MDTNRTAAAYDKIAYHWDSDEFYRENGIAEHERALRFVGSGGHAIDVGCGSSGRIIELLLGHGLQVEGFDISPKMLRLAKLRHPEVEFHLGDITTWEFPKAYDLISAWDSVWHVPLDKQELMLSKLLGALAPGGVLISTTGGVDVPGEASNPDLHGEEIYHAALGLPTVLKVIADAGCVCRHLEYDQPEKDNPGSHVYFIVQKLKV